RSAVFLLFFLSSSVMICGCTSPPRQIETAPEPRETIVLFLPGIGGDRPIVDQFIGAIEASRLAASVTQIDWAGDRNWLDALWNRQLNRQKTMELLETLRSIRASNPTAKIVVTAHSGGVAIACWALEASRPDEILVDDMVFLSAGLSYDYDLSAA